MNEDHIAPMTPLDQMLAQDSLQMLKAAVPYFPADAQRVFALYAKMMELSHTIAMFSGGPAELMMMSEESGTSQSAVAGNIKIFIFCSAGSQSGRRNERTYSTVS